MFCKCLSKPRNQRGEPKPSFTDCFGGESDFSKVFDGSLPFEVKSPPHNFGWPRRWGSSKGREQGKPCGGVLSWHTLWTAAAFDRIALDAIPVYNSGGRPVIPRATSFSREAGKDCSLFFMKLSPKAATTSTSHWLPKAAVAACKGGVVRSCDSSTQWTPRAILVWGYHGYS